MLIENLLKLLQCHVTTDDNTVKLLFLPAKKETQVMHNSVR